MTAPVIDIKLYDEEKRKRLQRDLDENYRGLEPLGNGKYPASLGVETAQLSEGFAYLECIALSQNLTFEKINALALQEYGGNNFRFVQPIPRRFLREENKSDAFAVYLRYLFQKDEPSKLKVKKEPMLGKPAI